MGYVGYFYQKWLDPAAGFRYKSHMLEEQNDPTTATPVEYTPAILSGAEADLGKRIGAALIDFLIAAALAFAAGMVVSRLSYPVWIAYMLTRDSLPFLNGQSVGKKALNLRAVSETGKTLSGDWTSGLIRNIPMVIPLGALVELIVMLVNKDKPGGLRRLGDQWGKTKVVMANANP